MAFNPRPAIDDVKEYDITKIHELPAPAQELEKLGISREYYMEWWKIGDEHNAIESGHFHTAALRYFLTIFLGFKKYTVIYLERVQDGKVIRDARNTLRR